MKNILIATGVNVIVILISFYLFKIIISGPIRHKLYEKFMSSFAKFIIYIFICTVLITGVTAFIFYRTRYLEYLNLIAPILVSILVGFVASTVPTRGTGDKDKNIIN